MAVYDSRRDKSQTSAINMAETTETLFQIYTYR